MRHVEHVAGAQGDLHAPVVGDDAAGVAVGVAGGGLVESAHHPVLDAGDLKDEDVGAVHVGGDGGLAGRAEEDERLEFGAEFGCQGLYEGAQAGVPVFGLAELEGAAGREVRLDLGGVDVAGDVVADDGARAGHLGDGGAHAFVEGGEVGADQQPAVHLLPHLLLGDQAGQVGRGAEDGGLGGPVVAEERVGVADQVLQGDPGAGTASSDAAPVVCAAEVGCAERALTVPAVSGVGRRSWAVVIPSPPAWR